MLFIASISQPELTLSLEGGNTLGSLFRGNGSRGIYMLFITKSTKTDYPGTWCFF